MDKLYLRKPDGHKQYCLCLETDNKEIASKFVTTCDQLIDCKVFHQANYDGFQMFEFWVGNYEEILFECQKVSLELDMNLEIK